MITKIIAVSLILAVVLFYLKNTANEYFVPVLIVSSLLVLSMSINYLMEFVEAFSIIKEITGISEEIFVLIFKLVAVSYLVEFCAGIICDMGLNSLAEKVVFGGKIAVLCMVFPIIKQIILILTSLL